MMERVIIAGQGETAADGQTFKGTHLPGGMTTVSCVANATGGAGDGHLIETSIR